MAYNAAPVEVVREERTFDSEIQRLAAKYAQDEETARSIIRCESGGNPEAINRQAVVGVDIGYWQLNTHFWEETMREQGWDIHDPWDNLEAGFWLLSKEGTRPWNWSKHCWNS